MYTNKYTYICIQLRKEREQEQEAPPQYPAVVGPDSVQRRDDAADTNMVKQKSWQYPEKPIL
jgi:hypothetical protein